jgi:ABC-2 type transport system ATP-binding protein
MMGALTAAVGVQKRYGKNEVLRGLDLEVVPREIVGLIGPNGAGKTTLLRILLGLASATGGRVTRPVGPVAYFAGGQTLPPRARADRWSAWVSRGSVKPRETRRVRTLSRGTRQMVGLEAVLAMPGADLIVLDEPWETLDPDASRWLTKTLAARREAGSGILVSSHRLHDLAGLCDRYAFLIEGRVVLRDAGDITEGVITGGELLKEFDTLRKPTWDA